MFTKVIPPAVAALLCCGVCAEQAPDPALAQCIDDDTLAVIRFDTARLDPRGAVDWIATGLRDRKVDPATITNIVKPVTSRAERSAAFLDGLRKAGASQVYWVLSVQDLTLIRSFPQFWSESGGSGIWAVPLDPKRDENPVIQILTQNADQGKPVLQAKRVGSAIIAAVPSRMPQDQPANVSPIWSRALAAGGDAPLQITIVPGTILRRAFEENLPAVPSPSGPLPISTFTQGVQFAVISIALPPNPRVSGFAQSPDPSSAKALADGLNSLSTNVRKQKLSLVNWLPPMEGVEKLLQFSATGDRVNWAPGQDIVNTLQPLIMAQMANSLRVQSAGNMKQILLGSIMYANNHKGQFSPDLPTMTKEQDLSPGVFIDPLDPFQKQGYIYVPPPAGWRMGKQNNDAELAILYEQFPGGHNVGYADGHIEWFATREEVEQELKKGRPWTPR